MIKNKPSISIFFPFLNDWGTVGSLVGLAVATVEKLADDWEILIINDGSKKEDREALQLIVDTINSKFKIQNSKLQLKIKNYESQTDAKDTPGEPARWRVTPGVKETVSDERIKIIDHEKNKGYGGALRSGFDAAKKDLIFYTDCDAQYDPRELTKLYEAMKDDVGMINGYKIKRNDPWFRVIAGRVYHHIVKSAFRLPIRDTDCDFRLIRREVFNKVKLFENTGTICVELVKKIDYHGYKIVEVPVHHFWRTSGKSQFFNFQRLVKTATNLFRLWWKLMVKKEYYK